MAQAFAPILKTNGGGALVQLNSIASMKNFSDLATYSASKAASYSITQALRDVLKEQGTHVVSVHPGSIATDIDHSRSGLINHGHVFVLTHCICHTLTQLVRQKTATEVLSNTDTAPICVLYIARFIENDKAALNGLKPIS